MVDRICISINNHCNLVCKYCHFHEKGIIDAHDMDVFEILDKFGISRGECLYFGDTNTDMLTAHNAGVTAVGVTWGFRGRSELEEYEADIIIDSAEEIPGLALSR